MTGAAFAIGVGALLPIGVDSPPLPRVENYFARMDVQESDEAKALISDMLERIESELPDFWDERDWFAFHGLNTEQAAMLNLADRKGAMRKVGSPVFTAGLGVAGDGTGAGYYDTRINPFRTQTFLTQDDGSMFLWSRTDLNLPGNVASSDMGCGTWRLERNATTAGRGGGRVSTSNGQSATSGAGAYPGFFGFNRHSSSTFDGWAQGYKSMNATAAASVAPTDSSVTIGRGANTGGRNQLAFTMFGAAMTDADIKKLREILRDFLEEWDILHGNLTPAEVIEDLVADLGTDLIALWDADDTTGSTTASGELQTWLDLKAGSDPTQGTAANRPTPETGTFNGHDAVDFDGTDFLRDTTPPAAIPSGATEGELWTLMDQPESASVTGTRTHASHGGTTAGTRRSSERVVSNGVNRVRVNAGNGSADTTVTDTVVDFSGRHLVRGEFKASEVAITVDDANRVAAAVTLGGTGTTAVGIGCGTSGSGQMNGKLNKVLITKPLSDARARGLRKYLMGLGGINGM